MDTTVFSKPQQTPAFAGNDQQSIQRSTHGVQQMIAGQNNQGGELEYEAYKIGNQARGLPVFPFQQWRMMFNHAAMLNR